MSELLPPIPAVVIKEAEGGHSVADAAPPAPTRMFTAMQPSFATSMEVYAEIERKLATVALEVNVDGSIAKCENVYLIPYLWR